MSNGWWSHGKAGYKDCCSAIRAHPARRGAPFVGAPLTMRWSLATLERMSTRPHVQKLVERARLLPALAAAMVFPCDSDSLQLALSGSFAGYLAPTLVGPENRIRDVANRAGLDISRLPIVNTADDPKDAALAAVGLASRGSVAALIK